MIVANLATYPPRRLHLIAVVGTIAPQVDRFNVVLNEYEELIPELNSFGNVRQVLPPEDLKDAGKFLPDTTGASHVFLVDDDLIYPSDFVAHTLASLAALPPGRFMGGYHGSIYQKPPFSLKPRHFKRWWRLHRRFHRRASAHH
jgi:hypothetical protein